MVLALKALKRVNFDWTSHLDQIWGDELDDVSELQRQARDELNERIQDLKESNSLRSPLGAPLLGAAGSGKTHLLGVIRKQAILQDLFFVLADMTDVRDFWETVLLGYLRSLQQPARDGRRQLDVWLSGMMEHYGSGFETSRSIPKQRPPGLINTCNKFIAAVTKKHPQYGQEHADVLRALLLFACDHAEINDLGYKWLQGIGIDDEERQHFGFREAQRDPQRVVRGLSWLLALEAPLVLALDQLDAIVAEHNLATQVVPEEPTPEHQMSLKIIQGIAGGLLALRDVTTRSLTIVSTLEATWQVLATRAVVSMADRFEEPLHLDAVNTPEVVERLVLQRLSRAYLAAGFAPSYPTYPFRSGFFQKYKANTPREVLKACDSHRRVCRKDGQVTETDGAAASVISPPLEEDWRTRLETEFAALSETCDVDALLNDDSEEALDRIVEAACDALILENPTPASVLPSLDRDFMGTGPYDPLHARIRLILADRGEREVHHSFRFLQKDHHRAFQARLKAAITASGIDKSLGFRRLTILRVGNAPGGPTTQKLIAELEQRGGRLVQPTSDELRKLFALSKLLHSESGSQYIDDWLSETRLVSSMPSFQQAAHWLFARYAAAPSPAEPHRAASSPGAHSSSADLRAEVEPAEATGAAPLAGVTPASAACQIPLGTPLSALGMDQSVTVELGSLTNHTCVFAGSGSGKTVFLKRIIEEAALAGVPSIVIDGANDLASLGQPWPEIPEAFTRPDSEKAGRYHATAEVVIWTPGIARGNPLVLNPIPDFGDAKSFGSAEDLADHQSAAIAMARSSLEPLIAPGKSAKDKKARAILAQALSEFAAHGGGSIARLIAMLREPPERVTEGYKDGEKIAQELSEVLLSEIKTDPLLGAEGTALDPASLLRSKSGRTRVSVINLSGLQGLEKQQKFLNQLAMTLFTWIKKNPAPSGSLTGLMVIDEAKDFVPSGKAVPCRDNVIRLAAQARKYGLGMLFATQAPKSIDHNVVANCSTLLVGKANSPAAIDTVQQLLQDKGGSGSDVAGLGTGMFYASTLAHPKPIKIKTPLCLSHHPSSPADENMVVELAKASQSYL